MSTIRWLGLPCFALLLSVFLPGLAASQQPPAMDPAKMQEMMKHMQDPAVMQRMEQQAEASRVCMKDVDPARLDALEKRGQAVGEEIEALCAAGKKDEALARGLAFHRELQGDPTIAKLRECSKGMTEAMKGMPGLAPGDRAGLQREKAPDRDDICSGRR
jgi:hypothetical protein